MITTEIPTHSTLHKFISKIDKVKRPDAQDLFDYSTTKELIEQRRDSGLETKAILEGLVGYLCMWTYTDQFDKNHAERRKYCIKLEADEPEICALFKKNKLYHSNMRRAIALVKMTVSDFSREADALLDKIAEKPKYEALEFSEKIAISEEVTKLVRKACKALCLKKEEVVN
jgi:hypothetical protein